MDWEMLAVSGKNGEEVTCLLQSSCIPFLCRFEGPYTPISYSPCYRVEGIQMAQSTTCAHYNHPISFFIQLLYLAESAVHGEAG